MDASDFFLSASEVATLTGFKLPHRQVDWLQRKGWRFEVNRNGRPIVARKYAEKMLGCAADDRNTPSIAQPNFEALRAI